MVKLTPKQTVLTAEPKATLDYYELLRGLEEPCWFIRLGIQGRPLSDIMPTPRAAWKNAADSLIASFRKKVA